MNFIAVWYIRICELRDALARGEASGATLVPNFLSALYVRALGFNKE